MRNKFFSKEDRKTREVCTDVKIKKIELIKAALCSNAVGKTTTKDVFDELLQRINDRHWQPERGLADFNDANLRHLEFKAPLLDQYMDFLLTEDPSNLLLSAIAAARKGAEQELGRTTVLTFQDPIHIDDIAYTGIALKKLRKGETATVLNRELHMQSILARDPVFRSTFPHPLHSLTSSTHFVSFAVPDGYYNYLSEIADTKTFVTAACHAAHDLGYLLKKYGQVFPGLISIFHAKNRPYTLLPDLTNAQAVDFGGLPGKIEDVIGIKLYENIGQTGLRDLGDLVSIDDYLLLTERGNQSLPQPLKIAHFISLYLMVFTLLMGNRSRLLERDAQDDRAWCENDKIFSDIVSAMFEGLGIKPSPDELAYIDPSLVKENTSKMQPGEKFNRQLYFCFTKFKDGIFGTSNIAPGREAGEHQSKLETYYGTKKVTFYCGDGGDELESRAFEGVRYRNFGYGGLGSADFYGSPGWLGQYSGINPLTTACKYALRVAQIVTNTLYHDVNVNAQKFIISGVEAVGYCALALVAAAISATLINPCFAIAALLILAGVIALMMNFNEQTHEPSASA